MIRLAVYCAAALSFLFPYGTAWAETRLTASVTPNTATIGDRLEYEITIESDENVKPALRLDNPAPFEVLGVRTLESGGDNIQGIVFTLTVFKPGRRQLPVYKLLWLGADGKPKNSRTKPVFVEIRSVLKPGQTEPENLDIEPVADAKLDWTSYLLPAAMLSILTALAAAIFYYFNKKRKQRIEEKHARRLTPFEAAMERLERLDRENPYAAGNIKIHFSEISDTMRDYLKEEFVIDAPEKTTTELAKIFPASLDRQRGKLIPILELCDGVKFAKLIPPPEEAVKSLRDAGDFLKACAEGRTTCELP
ncbi:MAG: hypothetical protein IEMM0002_0654 [bacterium]|nr:MAG: hypothetical protein IEMM0002_0654 [bacterium]